MKNKKTIKTISGKNVEGYTHFLYDGCHKFYLLKSGKLTTDIKDNGYEQSSIYPIDVLPDMFWDSCPLRFIDTYDNFKSIVPQCRGVTTFRNFGFRNIKLNFKRDKQYVW